jgi:hypothetical protein|tara:strand:+ start:376 stop:540 length:165 start_codon:yes stop_codon:yes gene_type:complete
MAHLGGQIYTSIKEAIINSTGERGLISTYQAADGELIFFINGKPTMTIKAPKKD